MICWVQIQYSRTLDIIICSCQPALGGLRLDNSMFVFLHLSTEKLTLFPGNKEKHKA